MKIVTFNIRCSWDNDGANSFIHRVGMILEKIGNEKPDVIGFQELTDKMHDFLESCLSEYLFLGHGRNADFHGEGVFTAIRKSAVELISTDTFWLTDTPYDYSFLPGQSDCPRTCVVCVLREKSSGQVFAVYNTHLDHLSGDVGDMVRYEELKYISKRICEDQTKRPVPFFLLGDLNAEPNHKAIQYCNEEFLPAIVDLTEEFFPTFHGFHLGTYPLVKIDYIYVGKAHASCFVCAEIWDDSHEKIYLSDHYPIAVEVQFK